MDSIKLLISDLKYLIATKCCDETLENRVNNYLKERDSNKVASSQPISGRFLTHEEIDIIRDKGWWDGYRQINKPKEK